MQCGLQIYYVEFRLVFGDTGLFFESLFIFFFGIFLIKNYYLLYYYKNTIFTFDIEISYNFKGKLCNIMIIYIKKEIVWKVECNSCKCLSPIYA